MGQIELRQHVVAMLDELPDDSLRELITFLEYLQYKRHSRKVEATPYAPVAASGIWAGVTISDADITAVRNEMWQSLGEHDL